MTDAVLDEIAVWRARPPEPVCPPVFFDASRVRIRDEGLVRDKAVHVALGVRGDETREVLGPRNEGAKFWFRVFNEIKNRGIEDILIAVVDGLNGFPDAIQAVFPETTVQTCIVHLIRTGLDVVSWKDRKSAAAALKDVCRADGTPGGAKISRDRTGVATGADRGDPVFRRPRRGPPDPVHHERR